MTESTIDELFSSLTVSGLSSHYDLRYLNDENRGMEALRLMFPRDEANEMNLCFFSTSGVHGSYSKIEEAEEKLLKGEPPIKITFLVFQPRVVNLIYGNCMPKTPEDIEFLKRLRETSHIASNGIGY